MQIETSRQKGITVLALNGRMDATTVSIFEAECRARFKDGCVRLVIDMKNLSYISSAGLRGILNMVKLYKTVSGGLYFCNLDLKVKEVFKITGFTNMLPIHETLDAAINDAAC